MKRSLRLVLAALTLVSALSLTACNDETKNIEAPGPPRDLSSKTEKEAQAEAQELLDNTVGS